MANVLGNYIRAQFILALAVGLLALIGLFIVRMPLAPELAIIAGLTEIIPVAGPWIGGIIGVIITLAVAPSKIIWVALIFLMVQLIENNVLVPRIQGAVLQIHPAIAMVLLVLGGYFAGFWGILLAVPLAATLAKIYTYFLHATASEDFQSKFEEIK